jgi:mRNA interferase RelE/StbE
MADLVLHRRAARYFERLDERLKAQLRTKLEQLALDPLAMPGVKPMAGEWQGYYRLRHGETSAIWLAAPQASIWHASSLALISPTTS